MKKNIIRADSSPFYKEGENYHFFLTGYDEKKEKTIAQLQVDLYEENGEIKAVPQGTKELYEELLKVAVNAKYEINDFIALYPYLKEIKSSKVEMLEIDTEEGIFIGFRLEGQEKISFSLSKNARSEGYEFDAWGVNNGDPVSLHKSAMPFSDELIEYFENAPETRFYLMFS